MGLLAVTTRGQALGVTRRGSGLADLVEVGEEGQHGLALAAHVHQGLAAAKRGLGLAEKTEDELAGLGHMGDAVGLLLGPAGPGHEQQPGVRADGLLVGGRRNDGLDRSASHGLRHWHRDRRHRSRARSTGIGGKTAAGHGQAPRPGRPGQFRHQALAVVAAHGHGLAILGGEARDMGVDAATQSGRDPGQGPGHTGGIGGNKDGGSGRLGQGFQGRRVGGIARNRKGFVRHSVIRGRSATGHGRSRASHIRPEQADGQRGAATGGQFLGRGQSFQGSLGQGAVRFGMGEKKNCFHGYAPTFSWRSSR